MSNNRDLKVLQFIGRWERGEKLVWLEPSESGCFVGQCAYNQALEKTQGPSYYIPPHPNSLWTSTDYPQIFNFDEFLPFHSEFMCWGCGKKIKHHEHANGLKIYPL